MATLKDGIKPAAIAPAQSTSGTGSTGRTGNVMSMSLSLGGKAVPFGKADVVNSKKTTKKRKQQRQKNTLKNYDDEGVGLP